VQYRALEAGRKAGNIDIPICDGRRFECHGLPCVSTLPL
jgi:hypothetical protein